MLAEPGFGPLTAGKLIGEIAGGRRSSSDARLARAGGIAPFPVSSGNTNRHRLDRGGNRHINTVRWLSFADPLVRCWYCRRLGPVAHSVTSGALGISGRGAARLPTAEGLPLA